MTCEKTINIKSRDKEKFNTQREGVSRIKVEKREKRGCDKNRTRRKEIKVRVKVTEFRKLIKIKS